MKITHSTELMKNQKHALIMSPDEQFKVLQTQGGNSLFFSIGALKTGNVFYCTRELPADKHGWSKIDLSSVLARNHNNAPVSAKTFAVSQNLSSGTTDLALVITANGQDFLYLSLGNSNTDDAWDVNGGSLPWTLIPFDDTSHNFTSPAIAEVYLSQSGNTEIIVADVVPDPSNNNIFRYFVDPSKKRYNNVWNPHDLAINIEAGNITNKVGRKKDRINIDGIYTMGTLDKEPQLVYTPVYNPFSKTVPPDPTRIVLPEDTTAFALSFNDPHYSDLFVTAGNSLYFLRSDAQTDQLTLTSEFIVYTHYLLAGTQSLHVNNHNGQVYVWGLNQQNQLFYLKCPAGNETTSAAWSNPVPIHENVQGVASYINSQFDNMSVFLHTNDDTMLHLSQDLVTTHWMERNIILPTADLNEYIETHTYTTHIRCTDDNNIPLSNTAMTISATETCSVYINDIYYVLHPNILLQISSDSVGIVTIVQSVDSIGSVCYFLSDGTQKISVNPMQSVLNKLQNVQSGDDLNATVKDEKGNSKPLIENTSITDDKKDQMASYVSNFVQLHKDLPADGTQKPLPPARHGVKRPADPADIKVFGIWFGNQNIQYFEGADQASRVGLVLDANGMFTVDSKLLRAGNVNSFETAVGDLWRWLKSLFEKVEHFFIQVIEGINHFFVSIAGAVYHFALRCINDILQGVQFVLNKIEIVFEKIVQWVGHIFGWDDVIRTHKVLKKLFNHYANYCIENIAGYRSEIVNLTTTVEQYINKWAGLPMDSYQSQAAAQNTGAGQNSPSSNWASHHTKGNISNANIGSKNTDTGSMLDDLFQALINEGEIFESAAVQLKNIFKNFSSLSMADFIKQILAVIADTFLESVENVLTAFLKIAEDMVKDVVDNILNAPIDIPVISPLYEAFAEDKLTMLDLVCLVVAMPVTFIYKLANNDHAPFPDENDKDYKALYDTSDFNAVANLCFTKTPQSGKAGAGASTPWQIETTSVYDKLTFAGNICAGAGGLLIAILGSLKFMEESTEFKSVALSTAYACAYLPYVAPDILGCAEYIGDFKKGWYNDLNALLGGIGLVKSFVDIKSCWDPADLGPRKTIPGRPDPDGGPDLPERPEKPGVDNRSSWTQVSPYIDLLLNVAWEVPVVFAYLDSKRNINDVLNLTGNTFFNTTGVLSPFIAAAENVEVKAVLIGSAAALNLGYGALSMAMSLDNLPTD